MRKTMGRGKLLTALLAIVIAIGVAGIASVALPGKASAAGVENKNSAKANRIQYGGANSLPTMTHNIDTGEDVWFYFTVEGSPDRFKDEELGVEGFQSLQISFENPNSSFFTFDKDSIQVMMSGVDRATGNPVNRDIAATAPASSKVVSADNKKATFIFPKSELGEYGQSLNPQSTILYNSETFTFAIKAHTSADPSVLQQYIKTTDPNAYVMSTADDATIAATVTWTNYENDNPMSDTSYMHFNTPQPISVVVVYMPVLDIRDKDNLLDPSQNAYYTIHRSVTILNTNANSKARGLVIEDVRNDNTLGGVGVSVDQGSVTVTNRAGQSLGTSSITYDKGGVKITLAPEVELPSGDEITVGYDIVMGKFTDNSTMSRLQEILEDWKVNSKVKVTAANAVNPIEKSAASTLLVPQATVGQTIACTKNLDGQTVTDASAMELTTGETGHVVVTIDPSASADGTLLINPAMTVDIPNRAAIEAAGVSFTNFKVNGTAYTLGNVISDGTDPQAAKAKGDNVTGVVSKNNQIKFEFDVIVDNTSPSVALNNLSVQVKTTFNAHNMISPLNGTASFTIRIPAAQASVRVDNSTPSAKDTVKVTATGTITDAPASGMVFYVKDVPSNGTACKSKFQNLTVTSSAGSLNASDYELKTTDNSVSIWFVQSRLIAKDETITVTYDDTMVDDYSGNGVIENISAGFAQNTDALASDLGVSRSPSVWSNLPTSALATTNYTVQTPALVHEFKITDPTSEEGTPAICNFGDAITYKATIQQTNAIAKGNDLTYKASIQDVLVGGKEVENSETGEVTIEGGKKYTAAEVGLSFKDDVKVMSGETDVTDQYTVAIDNDKAILTVTFKDPTTQYLNNTPIDIIFTLRTDTAPAKWADQLRGVEIDVASTVSISNLEASANASAKIKIANAEVKLTKSSENKEVRHGESETYTLKVENVFVDPSTGKLDPGSQIRGLSIKDTIDASAVEFGYKLDPDSFKVLMFDTSKEEAKDHDAGTYAVGEGGLEAGKYNIEFVKGKEYAAGTYTAADFEPGEYKITFTAANDTDVVMAVGDATAENVITGSKITFEEGKTISLSAAVAFTLTPTKTDGVVYGKIVRADASEEKLTSDGEITLAGGDSLVADVKFSLAMEAEGEDITKSEDVKILPTEDLSSFTFTYAKGLPTSKRIAIVYKATTEGIAESAYSQTLSNVAIASANNAKPAVATSDVDYIGKDIEPDPDPGYAGTVETGMNVPEPMIAPTGDMVLYIIGGVIICAVIAGGIVLIVRRRNR